MKPAELADLVRLRHDLHAHPEVGMHTPRTSELVAAELAAGGADEVHTGIGGSGVVGVVHGRQNATGRAVGLRADIDALPIRERNDVPHRSRYEGSMHACGHDGHTAMLLGAVRGLAADRRFDGTVVAIFQPGEEGHAGAKVMVEDGLFDRFPVSAIYALHNWPGLARDEVAVMAGPMMAARDDFSVRLSGSGGHGAQPHLCTDPVVAAAHFISAAQSIVSRNVDPSETAVVTIHSVQAGSPIALAHLARA